MNLYKYLYKEDDLTEYVWTLPDSSDVESSKRFFLIY